ncbi:baseplate wedge subunit [Citrobacter phage Moon]|uniref:Baseplate wedge protein gp10 n=1 Tax=Citrobacter phage Moon TaxID=1540095 RepID=A0A0A0YQY2_9CAUD|nr:baseplate wedge subunit [Citrobacter phage Moon]AIX12147.1 baseplate wedge subunit and tail pin [Citrobacter phage Moon]
MKQELKIGAMVDDGSGDYLRQGGQKINNNFNDLYYQLGDGDNPHAAGAWKTFKTVDQSTLKALMGHSYALDTATGRMTLELPKGAVKDYNTAIRVRDVFNTWQTNPVTIIPAAGDTLKGDPNPKEFNTPLCDLELVYCPPGRWEYVENKQINKISNSDMAAVIRKEYLVKVQDQVDFLDIFNGNDYNIGNTEVYHRGNILYYGETFSEDSDYGSPGTGDTIVALNGRDIRLRQKCNVGDTVIVISYIDGLSQWRSSYNKRQIILKDSSRTTDESIPGTSFVGDLKNTSEFTLSMFGISQHEKINPNSLEVQFNGITQVQSGTTGQPIVYCHGADADDSATCALLGGVWKLGQLDYSVNFDSDNIVTGISTDRQMEHGDIISLTWFNNNIGTTMELEDIIAETDALYVSQGAPVNLTGQISYTDFDKPQVPNIEPVTPTLMNITNPYVLFDLIYPVGTIYENASNPNNPATYMGMGRWKLWGEGKTVVGWNSDVSDPRFAMNNNDLDISGQPSHTAGGTTGATSVSLKNENLPTTQTDEKVLIADDNGNIIVGGCQFDPDATGPVYTKYREDFAKTNASHQSPIEVDVVQPSITAYRWLRIA